MHSLPWLNALAATLALSVAPSWRQVPLQLVHEDGRSEAGTVWSFVNSTHPAATKLANALDDAVRPLPAGRRDEFLAVMNRPGWGIRDEEVVVAPRYTWVLHVDDVELLDAEIANMAAIVTGEAYMFVHCPPLDERDRLRAWEQVEDLLPTLADQARQVGIAEAVVAKQVEVTREILGVMNEPGRYGAVLRPINNMAKKALIEETRAGIEDLAGQSNDKLARLLRSLWADAFTRHGLAWRPPQWGKGNDPAFDAIMERLRRSTMERARISADRFSKLIVRYQQRISGAEHDSFDDETLRSLLGLSSKSDHQPIRLTPASGAGFPPMTLTIRPTSYPSSQPESRPSD